MSYRYRLIVSDMDDTLLNEHGLLSEENIDAIARVRKAGAKVVLASGRMPRSMGLFVRQLGLTLPMISYNGAVLFDPIGGGIIHSFPVQRELAMELIEFCEARSLRIQAYEGDCFLTPADDAVARAYRTSLNNLPQMCVTGKPLSRCAIQDQPKLLLIDEPQRIRTLLPVFQKQFEGRLICTISRPQYIEFISPLAGKERALGELCRRLNIAPEEVVAFGDGLNDIEMLRFAGLGCAVANAREEVRGCADRVVPSNRENGVAQTILQLLAENKIGG